jgi:hypothetical protein
MPFSDLYDRTVTLLLFMALRYNDAQVHRKVVEFLLTCLSYSYTEIRERLDWINQILEMVTEYEK